MKMDEDRQFSNLEEVYSLLTSAVGKTFRQLDETNRGKSRGNKGALGQIIEESVLGYPINSNPQADIKVGDERYELKTTPVRHVGPAKERRISAKERLVLDIINYMTLPAEAFSDSAFWRKSKNIIVVCYLDDRVDRRNESPLDCKITNIYILDYPEDDLATIREDWQFIHDKVANGYADQLSEADTQYLAACTKGATAGTVRRAPAPADSGVTEISAKQRAFSYKQSYMTARYRRLIGSGRGIGSLPMKPDESLLQFLRGRFEGYVGRSTCEIREMLHLSPSKSKSWGRILVSKMLGLESPRTKIENVEQFGKANVTSLKNVVVYPGGRPQEHMSFPAITEEQWAELADPEMTWEESFVYRFFEENKSLITVFSSPIPYSKSPRGNHDDYVFVGGFLWNMPEEDIQRFVQPVWDELRRIFLSGESIYDENGKRRLPGTKFNRVCHVRPHAQRGSNKVKLPNGESVTIQGLWLDRNYIAKIIRDNFGDVDGGRTLAARR